MWWAALLVFKYVYCTSEIKERADRSCVDNDSGSLVPSLWRFAFFVGAGVFAGIWSQSNVGADAGCEIHAESPLVWGQLMVMLSCHLLLFLSSFHSTVEEIQGEKRQNNNIKAGDGAILASAHIWVLVCEPLMTRHQDSSPFDRCTSANIG